MQPGQQTTSHHTQALQRACYDTAALKQSRTLLTSMCMPDRCPRSFSQSNRCNNSSALSLLLLLLLALTEGLKPSAGSTCRVPARR